MKKLIAASVAVLLFFSLQVRPEEMADGQNQEGAQHDYFRNVYQILKGKGRRFLETFKQCYSCIDNTDLEPLLDPDADSDLPAERPPEYQFQSQMTQIQVGQLHNYMECSDIDGAFNLLCTLGLGGADLLH